MLFLNIFIGLFTARLFVRYLHDDFRSLTAESDGKKVLNEYYSYLLMTGIFMRCYFYFKEHDDENSLDISFPIIHQSKLTQIKRDTLTVVKSSFKRSLMPTFHFIGFYIFFGNSFGLFIQKVALIGNDNSGSLWSSMLILFNIRLLLYTWILAALTYCNIQLIRKIINTFATQPKQFAISTKTEELTLTKALQIKKFQITRHLAAQDLSILADSADDKRRKEFYELSVPGSHPHNWKQLVLCVTSIVDEFNNDMKTTLEYVAKNRHNVISSSDALKKFYDHKRIIRETNEIHGIRSFMTSPIKQQEETIEERSKILMKLKEKLLSIQVIGYLFGELESGKLNFLLCQNSQVIIWLIQGVSAIMARSIKEDNYGIVQHDFKTILKSFLKLRATIDKVGAINTIVKNRNFIALRAALRRSLYRIVTEFSPFFDDMLLDGEDIKALVSFVTFKEL